MEEIKKVEVKWTIGEATKFGFGFGMGIFLWAVAATVTIILIVWLIAAASIGIPSFIPTSQTTTGNVGSFGGGL
jgi:hypothetical protein